MSTFGRKVAALCTATFFVWSLIISAPIYADGNRVEFNKELSREKESKNYDKLANNGAKGGGEKENITSGSSSANGAVAQGSVSSSTAGGAVSGTASGSVLSGSAEGNYSVDSTESGIEANANVGVKGTVAEGTATGQANTSLGPINAGAQGTATGSIGGEAQVGGQASVTTSGVTLEGSAGASMAAKVSGEGSCTVSCFGVSMTGTVEGDLRAGASAEAKGIISINKGKIIFGGKIAGAVGVGGGIGSSIEIDASELIDNVKGWFNSWFESTPESEPNPTPDITSNFKNFDALQGGGLGALNTSPTAVLDGFSSRDMSFENKSQDSAHKSGPECEGQN